MKKQFWISLLLSILFVPTFGQTTLINGITVMVEYPDLAFGNSVESVSLMMNQTGFTGFGSQGSVKDYFFTQSNGKVIITSQVVKVKVPLPSSSYHGNGATGDLVGDIIDQINLQFPNGFQNLSVEPSQGGLWHFNLLTKYPGGGYAFGFGNKFIKNNGTQLEIKRGNITFFGATDVLGINTICHETGHSVFSWTDYYRTAFCNLGDYDVMASAGTSKAPMPINPALRWQKRWIDNVVTVSGNTTATYTLTANNYSQIHKYSNPNNLREYLLFHVVKHGGYYQSPLDNGKIPDEGLSIWYVDEDCKFDKEGVDNQYFIRLVQADNLDEMHDEFIPNTADVRGDSNDMYDNISNSFPNGTPFRWKDGGEFGISISNISAPGNTMSFTVNARPNTVVASSDLNGTISPKGTLSVPSGQSKVFTFIPNIGYELDVVRINSVPVAATNPFTLTEINGTKSIQVSFKKKAVIEPLPAPWENMDIGLPKEPGLAAHENGKFNIESTGTNIGGTSDSFGYEFQTLNGNGSIVARLASSNRASWGSKVGIMLRESLQPNASYSMIGFVPHSGITSEMRTATGSQSVNDPNNKASFHIYSLHNWFKISRVGNQITNSCSRDGVNWIVISQQDLPISTSVYVGLVATGGLDTFPSKALFDNVTVTSANPSPIVSITSPANNTTFGSAPTITITATASDSNGSIQKVEFYNGTQLLGEDTTSPYSFTMSNVSGGKYSLNAKATDNQGATTTSKPISIKVPCTFSAPKIAGTVIGTSGSWANGGNTREKAFDGDVTTFFDAPSDIGWTGLSLSKEMNITGINFYPREGFTGRMLGGKFQGSNTADFSSGVEDLATITQEPTLEWNCVTIATNSSYKFVRYICAAGGVGNVGEIEFYGTDIKCIPNLSFNNTNPSICFGNQATITASGGSNYVWSPADGLDTTLGATVLASPQKTTTYTVKATQTGCPLAVTKTVTLTVNSLPIISVSPDNSTICSGDSKTLTASGASTYSWSPATGLNTTTGAVVAANPISTTTYVIKGTSAQGCTSLRNATVTVNPNCNLTIWFKKPANIQAPKLHYWNVNQTSVGSAWPGVLMTPDLSKGNDWFKFTIPNAVSASILFHDGASYKTIDLPNITGGCFDGNTNTWVDCNQDLAPVLTISPPAGNYTSPITVTLSVSDDKDPNPVIYYTTDGSTPNTASLSFVKQGTISISSATTLRAFARDNTNHVTLPQTLDYTFNQVNGLTIWFKKPANIQAPKIHYWNVNPAAAGSAWPGVLMTQDLSKGTDWYKFTIPNAVSANILFHDGASYKTIDLTNITGGCFDGNTNSWVDCNQDNAPVLTISPIGGNFTGPVTVTLSATDDKDPNPVIYYTLDGTAPTTSSLSFVKQGTLTISASATLKAFAKDNTNHVGVLQTVNYTFNTVSNVTVWFKRPTNTQLPRIHYWNVVPAMAASAWPGVLMIEDLSKGANWYKYTISGATSSSLLFHDGASYKTADLINISGGCYDGNTKTWVDCGTITTKTSSFAGKDKKISSEASFIMYPNPTFDHVTILYPEVTSNKIEIRIFDMLGKSIYLETTSVTEGSFSKTIDTKDLKSGIYTISIADGEKIVNRKLIKN